LEGCRAGPAPGPRWLDGRRKSNTTFPPRPPVKSAAVPSALASEPASGVCRRQVMTAAQPVRVGRDNSLYCTSRCYVDPERDPPSPCGHTHRLGERAACRAGGRHADWSLFVFRVRGCSGRKRIGGETLRCETASWQTATKLSRRYQPPQYRKRRTGGDGKISPKKACRLSEVVFFKKMGRFLLLLVLIYPSSRSPSCFPRAIILSLISVAEDSLCLPVSHGAVISAVHLLSLCIVS
jgi:hypothetical protein